MFCKHKAYLYYRTDTRAVAECVMRSKLVKCFLTITNSISLRLSLHYAMCAWLCFEETLQFKSEI